MNLAQIIEESFKFIGNVNYDLNSLLNDVIPEKKRNSIKKQHLSINFKTKLQNHKIESEKILQKIYYYFELMEKRNRCFFALPMNNSSLFTRNELFQ